MVVAISPCLRSFVPESFVCIYEVVGSRYGTGEGRWGIGSVYKLVPTLGSRQFPLLGYHGEPDFNLTITSKGSRRKFLRG
jgi:hypothetical protein